MLHIAYTLKTSPLHGIGLFAASTIKKGQIVYTDSPLLDLNITQKQFNSLSESEQKEICWWGFFDEPSQKWHVDFDVTKFINHAVDATLTQDKNHTEAYLIAIKDIQKGEELTQNYLEFETVDDLKRRSIKI